MSDPDSAQRRRPPTIDLTAQEVETGRPADGTESSAASAANAGGAGQGGTNERGAGATPRRTTPYIVSGLIGAAAAAAIIVGLWLAGLAPQSWSAGPKSATSPSAAPPSGSTRMSEIEAQLDKLRGAPEAKPLNAGSYPQGGSSAPPSATGPSATRAPGSARMAEIEAKLDRLRGTPQAKPPDAGSSPPGGNATPQTTTGPSAAPAPRAADMSELESQLDKLRAASQARSPDAGSSSQRGSRLSPYGIAPTAAPAPGSTRTTDVETQLDKLRGVPLAKPSDTGLTPPVSDSETRTKALSDSVAALTHRIDEIAASTRDLATDVKAAAAAAAAAAEEANAAAQNKGQSGDVDQIARRLDAIENAVKSLTADTARASSSADDRVARAAAAAAALAAVVERSAPFRAELDSVAALGADENAIAALTPFAADGLPSAAALSRELVQLLPALRQASVTAPKEDSLIARLEMNAQKLVRITRTDSAPKGDDASSIISRIDVDAQNGDVAGALADIARLPPQPRALAGDWTKKAQAREAAIAASRRIAAEAAAALSRPAGQ